MSHDTLGEEGITTLSSAFLLKIYVCTSLTVPTVPCSSGEAVLGCVEEEACVGTMLPGVLHHLLTM